MRNVCLVVILDFIINSCSRQEIDVNHENIQINIPGEPRPWLKHNNKYNCYFEVTNELPFPGNLNFYILDKIVKTTAQIAFDKKGKTTAQIAVPKELQTFYIDLYVKNDTVFTTEYNNQETYFLDETNKKWCKTKKGIDLYYEDDDYSVYSLDFGEWGGVTWFK